jgi:hypothetical protein
VCRLEIVKPLAETLGIALAALGERQIGATRVLAREAPGGFTMPRQVDDLERVGGHVDAAIPRRGKRQRQKTAAS